MNLSSLPLQPVVTLIAEGVQVYPQPGGGSGDPVVTDPEGGRWRITVDPEGVLVTEPVDGE